VQAKVSAIGAFSAHADQRQLDRWLLPEDQQKPKKIFLVHGDEDTKEVFAKHLRDTHQTEVVIPEFQSVHEL
jgi:metallo-beta-lactamase family protein